MRSSGGAFHLRSSPIGQNSYFVQLGSVLRAVFLPGITKKKKKMVNIVSIFVEIEHFGQFFVEIAGLQESLQL